MSITVKNPTRRHLLAIALVVAAVPGSVAAKSDPNSQERTGMKVRFVFAGREMIATLYDNPSARDFASMLPMNLEIDDFGSNEKIAQLPRRLTHEGQEPFSDERPYDLCYYMPWGNLAMFYDDYNHPGLIRLGRFEEGYRALHVRGKFPLLVERIQ